MQPEQVPSLVINAEDRKKRIEKMENKKTWKDEEIKRLEDLKLYIDYLSESELQEDDGTEEGAEIVKTHFKYQDKLKAILNEIIKSYELYKDYDSFENEVDKIEFKNKYQVISYILLASSEEE